MTDGRIGAYLRTLDAVQLAVLECCSTHCERRQECASPNECVGNATGKASAAIKRAAIRARTPSEPTEGPRHD